MCFLNIMTFSSSFSLMFPSYCESAAFLTVLTRRHHKNYSWVRRWEGVKTSSLKKSTILHMQRLTLLSFLLHPSFFCIAVAIGLEHLGIVFSIPRQLERVTGCLAIRSAGETQMVQFSCHPVCLAETSGSKWRRIYSNTHIHTHTDAHTSSIK